MVGECEACIYIVSSPDPPSTLEEDLGMRLVCKMQATGESKNVIICEKETHRGFSGHQLPEGGEHLPPCSLSNCHQTQLEPLVNVCF